MSWVRLAWHGFLSSKLTIFQFKMNDLQGQHIHTLLCHSYSALSLIDNLSVLSESRYAHAARTDPAIKYMTQKALVRACSAWAIRVSKAQICCSERMLGTGYCQTAHSHSNYIRVTDRYRVLFENLIEFASQEIWLGPAECRQLPPANT